MNAYVYTYNTQNPADGMCSSTRSVCVVNFPNGILRSAASVDSWLEIPHKFNMQI